MKQNRGSSTSNNSRWLARMRQCCRSGITRLFPRDAEGPDFIFGERKKERFRRAVLVEFPRDGSYSLGFVVHEVPGSIAAGRHHRRVSVFVPLIQAPFSGLILTVTPDRIRETNVSVDRAIRLLVAGGVVN